MKISTKGRLATGIALATIGLIAAVIWWANTEVDDANRQRRQTSEITRALNDLRLVSFEYILHRTERARLQEHEVATRLDRLIADDPFRDPQAIEVLAQLREDVQATHRIFEEFLAGATPGPDPAAGPDATRLFEAQLSSRLLVLQQESLTAALRLADHSTQRIDAAQRRVVVAILLGLALIAVTTAAIGWLIGRHVLRPIARLEQATREVAAGNWNFQVNLSSRDEIGDMARNFDAMTRALREAFAEVQRKNDELAALNKEIEAFSYSVSHDLRAPLRSMDGFSLALIEDYGDKLDADALDSLNRIRAASQRMGRLIDELLGLSRVTRTELVVRSVNLSAIAREIADSLERMHPGRDVRWEISEGMTVQADKSLMHIAMQNLLENAWKFTGKTANAVIRVGIGEANGERHCFVADNGVGFDMSFADRLFGAFQRLHHESEFSGTGIGLAIVQRIFRRHEGRIWVQARPGEGATFFFSFKEPSHE